MLDYEDLLPGMKLTTAVVAQFYANGAECEVTDFNEIYHDADETTMLRWDHADAATLNQHHLNSTFQSLITLFAPLEYPVYLWRMHKQSLLSSCGVPFSHHQYLYSG